MATMLHPFGHTRRNTVNLLDLVSVPDVYLIGHHHSHPEEHVKTLAGTLFVALLATAAGTTIAAQDNMGQGAMGGQANKAEIAAKLEKMSTELQLTPAQKQQMLPILKEEAPKLQAIKSNTSLGPMQKAMQLRQIGEATDAKVQPILSPAQYQKWQQMRTQERQEMIQKMENKQ